MSEKCVRVRAVRWLVVCDDDQTIHMVPKGMTGTLVGCAGSNMDFTEEQDRRKAKRPHFAVEWDFHAIGGSRSTVFARDDDEPKVIRPDFPCDCEPDDIEFIGVGSAAEEDDSNREERA